MTIYLATMFSPSILVSINSSLCLLIYPSLPKIDIILLSGNHQTTHTLICLLFFSKLVQSIKIFSSFLSLFCLLLYLLFVTMSPRYPYLISSIHSNIWFPFLFLVLKCSTYRICCFFISQFWFIYPFFAMHILPTKNPTNLNYNVLQQWTASSTSAKWHFIFPKQNSGVEHFSALTCSQIRA